MSNKTIYQLRDEHYNYIEDIIYEQVSGDYDFHNGLENIIEKLLNDEDTLSNILFDMEIVEEDDDNE